MSGFKDLTGHKIENWTVLSRAETIKGHTRWNCICICGNKRIIQGSSLITKVSRSCGCSFPKGSFVKTKEVIEKFIERNRIRAENNRKLQLENYKINTENNCWEWQGHKNEDGYGKVKRNGKTILSHRLFYEVHKGIIPEGNVIMHTCDNPGCVNPEHLKSGTHLENEQDKDAKGRRPPSPSLTHPELMPRGENHPNFGKPMPEYIKDALRKANLGKVISDEHRNKISSCTREQVISIRKDNRAESAIAKENNISQATVNRIRKRLRYRHIL